MRDEEKRRLAGELTELVDSFAWTQIEQFLEAHAQKALDNLGKSADLPESAVHFNRGVIWAFREAKVLPARMQQTLESDLMFEEKQRSASAEHIRPAQAGQEKH